MSKEESKRTWIEDEVIEKMKENNKDYDRVVLLRVDLIDICEGDMNAGIMLSQIIFWAGRGVKKNDGWFFKPATEWFKETRLKDHKVKDGTKKLKKLHFIDTENRVAKGHNTRWYKLNLETVLFALDKLYEFRKESIPVAEKIFEKDNRSIN